MKTVEEVELVLPAFNLNGEPGILQTIVLGRRERERAIFVNSTQLKERYARLDCVGVVKLIEFLGSDEGRGLRQIGTGTIDLFNVGPDEFFQRVARDGSYGIYIGIPNIGLSPLQWLAYLSKGLDQVVPEQIKAFDEVCGELVECVMAPRCSL